MVEVEIHPPGKGEVLLRTLATSLCNQSEMRSFRGGTREAYGSRYPMLPGEPGHEGVGVVQEVGQSVSDLSVGDIVALTGWGGDPAHRSMLVREAAQIARIHPGSRDPREASILEMYASAYHCVKRGWEERRFENSRVAIIGMGAIGFCSLQCIHLWPVREIVAFDLNSRKLALALEVGADRCELVSQSDAPGDAGKRYGRFDIVVECSGAVAGQAIAHALKPRVLINVSYISDPLTVNQTEWFWAETTIYNPGLPRANDLRAVANLYNRELIHPGALITSRIKPDIGEYAEAIREIERGNVVKTLIEWEKG
jgi:threonine dehydrogenase-like Zn-dependent dehydrogenase